MVYIMSKCKQCNVIIRDKTHVCPLCHYVLEREEEGQNTYPNVRLMVKQLNVAGRIFLFCLLVVSAVLTIINYETYNGTWWCGIVIASLAYLYLILRFAIIEDAGYRIKLIVLTVCGILLVVLIDFITGYEGWSVNYVMPGGILLADAGIVVLMLVNMRNWQSYLLFQIVMILGSLIPILFWRLDIITKPLLSMIALGVSVFLFLGTFIIGDRRAKIELKRRFHVR